MLLRFQTEGQIRLFLANNNFPEPRTTKFHNDPHFVFKVQDKQTRQFIWWLVCSETNPVVGRQIVFDCLTRKNDAKA